MVERQFRPQALSSLTDVGVYKKKKGELQLICREKENEHFAAASFDMSSGGAAASLHDSVV